VKLILLALSWLSLSSALFAQKPPTLAGSAQNIAKGMPRGCIVTGEWRDGKAVYAISGPDKPTNVPAEKVVFEIGSISKVFTGLLLAQAVLEKKLTFETTLKQALDAKQAFGDDKVAAITLAQLATHTSGLPSMPGNTDFSAADPYATYDAKKLTSWLATVKLEQAAPAHFSYSNVGIALLGHILERSFNDSWSNLVHDRICKPLGMLDTMQVLTSDLRSRLAPPFEGKDDAHEWSFQVFASAGGLHSTAADLMLFGRALNHPETSPLREAIQLAVKPLAEGIGCCFFLGDDLIAHNGGTGGYRTLLQAKPKTDQVRIVLINNAEMEPVMVTRPLDRGQFNAVEGPKLSEAELKPYVGVFKLGEQAKFTFIIRDGGLWCKLTGQAFLPYLHEKKDVFFHRGVAARLIFGRDASGAINSVTLDQNNHKQVAKRLNEQAPEYLFRPAKELEEFTGVYDFFPPDKVFTIELRRGTLFVQLTGQPFLPVFETKPRHFEYDVVFASLEFERDEAGKIKRLHITQNGLKLPALKRTK
jgi:CubicO group peptidase (beta-lactamase class C family)